MEHNNLNRVDYIEDDLECITLIDVLLQEDKLYSSSATVPTPGPTPVGPLPPLIRAVFMTSRRSLFRPCIDLHDGHVKQIVGGTLSETDPGSLKTNFVAKCAVGSYSLPNPANLA